MKELNECQAEFEAALKVRRKKVVRDGRRVKELPRNKNSPIVEKWKRGATIYRSLGNSFLDFAQQLGKATQSFCWYFGMLDAVFTRIEGDERTRRLPLSDVSKYKAHFFSLIKKQMTSEERDLLKRTAASTLPVKLRFKLPAVDAAFQAVKTLAQCPLLDTRKVDKLELISKHGKSENKQMQLLLRQMKFLSKHFTTGGKDKSSSNNLVGQYIDWAHKKKIWNKMEALIGDWPVINKVNTFLEDIDSIIGFEIQLLLCLSTMLKAWAQAWDNENPQLQRLPSDMNSTTDSEMVYVLPPAAWRYWKAHMIGHLQGAFAKNGVESAEVRATAIKLNHNAEKWFNMLAAPKETLDYEWERCLVTGVVLSREGTISQKAQFCPGDNISRVPMVIDNISTDALRILSREFCKKNPRIFVRNAHNSEEGRIETLESLAQRWKQEDTIEKLPELVQNITS